MQLNWIQRRFANHPIVRQLLLLRTLVITGFVILAIGYAVAVTMLDRALAVNGEINEFRKLVLEIQADLFQARRNERDFLADEDEEYAIEYAKSMGQLYGKIDLALGTQTDPVIVGLMNQVKTSMKQYEAGFTKVLSTKQAMGLDEESGLLGTMIGAARKAQAATDSQKQDALTITLLIMRRHEKEFIMGIDSEYANKVNAGAQRFEEQLAKARMPETSKKVIAAHMAQYRSAFRDYAAGSEQVNTFSDEMLSAVNQTESLLAKLQIESAQRLAAAEESLKTTMRVQTVAYGGALVLILVVVAGALQLVSAAIMRPLERLTDTVRRLAEGDHTARAALPDNNEFGQFGNAFDRMMDDRVMTQNAIEHENELLNESVLNLLQAVAKLARKDLTVRIPVTEDVTGPIADALNMLASETGKVLSTVTDISTEVTAASLKVREHTETVNKAAATGRREAEQTAESLAAAAQSMTEIAGLAQECSVSAERAISTTHEALQAVADTVGGINDARDTIRETEKRIKRLGERSQEISVAVNLINTIAERTHILALNASMHAASAGEAGRGFAVVAEEVQRLAENARQATAQIASLVSNIQVETSDTINTMNSAITRVVEGAKLADQASDRMQQTETSTSELVSLVQRIATDSSEQAKVSSELLQRAAEIRKSTEETSHKVEEAGQYITHLVGYARNLLTAVRGFKLPA